MSHGAVYYRALGRLIAEAKPPRIAAVAREYGAEFMSALTHPATRKRHTNVLHHLMGYLERHLNNKDKVELLGVIESFRLGQMPLAAPITLLKHHFRRFPDPYIDKQTYLHPHPTELALRSGACAARAGQPAGATWWRWWFNKRCTQMRAAGPGAAARGRGGGPGGGGAPRAG